MSPSFDDKVEALVAALAEALEARAEESRAKEKHFDAGGWDWGYCGHDLIARAEKANGRLAGALVTVFADLARGITFHLPRGDE